MSEHPPAPERSLPLAWNWPLHLGLASAAAVTLIGIMVIGRPAGWGDVVLVVLLAWGLFAGNVWLRRRARLVQVGPVLWFRRMRRWQAHHARHVVGIAEVGTWSGRGYRLTRDDETRVLLPAALFAGGHSTVLGWALDHARQATFDKAARRSVIHLQERGRLHHEHLTFDDSGRRIRPDTPTGPPVTTHPATTDPATTTGLAPTPRHTGGTTGDMRPRTSAPPGTEQAVTDVEAAAPGSGSGGHPHDREQT